MKGYRVRETRAGGGVEIGSGRPIGRVLHEIHHTAVAAAAAAAVTQGQTAIVQFSVSPFSSSSSLVSVLPALQKSYII